MIRNCELSEISDGKLYRINDMVKVGCNDCKDCYVCCTKMGQSVVLDPYDVYRIGQGLSYSFEQLLSFCLELNVVDGMILPNMKMAGELEECVFLNEKKRCSIHQSRPGICRLFPLGRFYENGDFQYFLQRYECKKQGCTKVKVSKWIATKEIKRNHTYINQWHYYLKDLQGEIKKVENEAVIKEISMDTLKRFYICQYNKTVDFYVQFEERIKEGKIIWGIEAENWENKCDI